MASIQTLKNKFIYLVIGEFLFLAHTPRCIVALHIDIQSTLENKTLTRRGIQKFELGAIGLDCEKCPDVQGRDTPCLLQLASDDDGFAALFRVNKMETLPAKLIVRLKS